jgi:hypothetical protein
MSNIYTPVYTNTMMGANANPFDAVNWTVLNGSPIQILNQVGIGGGVAEGWELYNGTISNDQYIQFTIAELAVEAAFRPYLRTNSNASQCYYLGIYPYGAGEIEMILTSSASGTVWYDLGTFSLGDTFLFAVIGTTLSVFQNGVSLFSGTDTSIPTGGVPGMFTEDAVVLTDTAFTNLIVGNVTVAPDPPSVWSQPDCRLTPNTGVTVNGTVQYTGQTSSNPNVPPTDSRKAGAPQDCRLPGNVPQNCRTQPPFAD